MDARSMRTWRDAVGRMARGAGDVSDARMVQMYVDEGAGNATPSWLADRYPGITEADLETYTEIAKEIDIR